MARSLENNESIERRLKGRTPISSQRSVVRYGLCAVAGSSDHWLPATGHGYVSVIGWSGRDLNPVLAGFLDQIHGFVRGLDQFLGRRGGVGQRRDADRDREVNIEAVVGQKRMRGDPLA